MSLQTIFQITVMKALDLYIFPRQILQKTSWKQTMNQKQRIAAGTHQSGQNILLWTWVAHTLLSMSLLKIHIIMKIGTRQAKN